MHVWMTLHMVLTQNTQCNTMAASGATCVASPECVPPPNTHTQIQHLSTRLSIRLQVAGHKVGCVVVDEPHGLLWVGDRDGMVAAYECPQGALLGEAREGTCARPAPKYQFQAFSAGSVTAMARAATGALWAGSARGSLRIFEFGGAMAMGGVGVYEESLAAAGCWQRSDCVVSHEPM